MADEEREAQPTQWARDELIGLLSVSGTLAGLCITIVVFMATIDKARSEATIVDDLLAICALLFLVCTYVTFWALRSRDGRVAARLIKVVDVLFLVALSVMTLSAFLFVYTIW